MKNLTLRIILALVCLSFFSHRADAQFREEAFRQTYNNPGDTT